VDASSTRARVGIRERALSSLTAEDEVRAVSAIQRAATNRSLAAAWFLERKFPDRWRPLWRERRPNVRCTEVGTGLAAKP